MNWNTHRSAAVAAFLTLTGILAPVAHAQDAKREPADPARVERARQDLRNKEVAQKVAHFERAYRDHLARIERLIGIYKAKGHEAKVRELEALKTKLEARRENAMQGFRQDLGPETWSRLERELKAPRRVSGEGEGKRALQDAVRRVEREAEVQRREREKEQAKEKEPERKSGQAAEALSQEHEP